jgi:hypothetical protein
MESKSFQPNNDNGNLYIVADYVMHSDQSIP